MNVSAVILAGGRGTRLHPLTLSVPKPLLPLGTTPILDIVLRQIAGAGIRRVTIAIGYLGAMVEEHVGSGERFGLVVTYLKEGTPLGTAGVLGHLPEARNSSTLVMNGDLLTRIDLAEVVRYHAASTCNATIVCATRTNTVDFGVLQGTDSGLLERYLEKPSNELLVSCGIYLVDEQVVSLVERDHPLDMPELFNRALDQGLRVGLFETSSYWQDIGRVDDYRKATDDFLRSPRDFA